MQKLAADLAIPDSPAGRQLSWVLAVINAGQADEAESRARFADTFLAQVPPAKFSSVAAQLHQAGGGAGFHLNALRTNRPTRLLGTIQAGGDGLALEVSVNLEPATGKMNGLLFTPAIKPGPPAKFADWKAVDAALAELPGQVALGVYPVGAVGTPVHEDSADRRLAIGSTFKLYVLGCLAEKIAAGKARWSDEIAVNEAHKSLPSGTMQDDPAGTRHTLVQFARMMISISDNTAADHLLAYLGRDAVGEFARRTNPDCGRPFLATQELFKLKLVDWPHLADRYLEADEPARRAMLAPEGAVGASKVKLADAANWKEPRAIERLEWFATPRQLAALFANLHAREATQPELREILRVNPGLHFDPAMWKSVAFKGGSEPGVVNLTFLLERKDDAWFVCTITWNNPQAALDEGECFALTSGVVDLLATTPKP